MTNQNTIVHKGKRIAGYLPDGNKGTDSLAFTDG